MKNGLLLCENELEEIKIKKNINTDGKYIFFIEVVFKVMKYFSQGMKIIKAKLLFY
jgi:hypothetical protein